MTIHHASGVMMVMMLMMTVDDVDDDDDDHTPRLRITRSVFTKRAGLVDAAASRSTTVQGKGIAQEHHANDNGASLGDGLVGCPVVRTLCLVAQMTPEQRRYTDLTYLTRI